MRRAQWTVTGGIGLICLVIAVLAAITAAPGETAVRADQGSDASLQELAQRYLQQTNGGQVELFPGQIPADVPVALPMPAGSRLIGTVVRHLSTQTTYEVLLDVPGTSADATANLTRALSAGGFATPTPFNYAAYYVPNGFQDQRPSMTPASPAPTRTPNPNLQTIAQLCQPSGVGIVLTARPLPNNSTGVTLQVTGSGSNSFCAQNRPTPGALPRPSLPALTGPGDADVSQIDYDEVGDGVSDATITSDLSPAELEALYGKQLAAAGWTRITGDARGPLAWSLWSTPSGKQGYLSVLEIAGQGIRDLHIQIDSLSSDQRGTLPPMNRSSLRP